jgi:hypothetical protein
MFPIWENRFRTFFQYSVANSTEIVDALLIAWQDGTCSPVDGDHGGAGARVDERQALGRPLLTARPSHSGRPNAVKFSRNLLVISYSSESSDNMIVRPSDLSVGGQPCTLLTNGPICKKL